MSAATRQKRQLGRRAQAGLVAVGLLLVAALGYMVLIGPKRSRAGELETEIAAVQAQINEYRVKALEQHQEPVEGPDLFRLAKAIPDRADVPGIILELNRIATDSGIGFESIAPGASVVQGDYQVIPITHVVEGNFYSLTDFLFRLRNLVRVDDGKVRATGRLFSIETLALGEAGDGFPELLANLTVNAYVFGTGAPASPAPPLPTSTTTTGTTTTPTTTSASPPNPSTPPAPPNASAAPATP
jgi:hypothetical protein